VFHLDDTLLDGANMLERMDDIAKQDSKLPTNRFVDEEPELESGEEEE
jgi:hypothetical protein